MLMIPTLLGVTFVVFMMVRAVPGDVLDLIGGDFGAADPAVKEALKKEFGLEGNLALQYLEWLGRVVRLDFGESIISGRTVTSELSNRVPVTLELGLLGIFFSVLIAIPVGVISAIRQDTWVDYVARSFAIGLLAVPGFWVAIVLISLTSAEKWPLIGSNDVLKWLFVPPTSYVGPMEDPLQNFRMMWVPAMLLGAGLSGSVMRFTRSAMLEVQRQDYIRTAWAKGLRERAVIIRHALRNALIPVITVIGLQIPIVVGGTVLIEQVYSIPGMGRYYIQSVNQLDYPVIQAINVMVASVVVLVNLSVDLLYSIIDPRIRYS